MPSPRRRWPCVLECKGAVYQMTDIQEIKLLLIERGIWNADDRRDPLTDRDATELVFQWMRDQVAPNVVILPAETENSTLTQIYLKRREGGVVFPYILDSAQTIERAICLSALVLKDFLHSHPECMR